MIPKLILKTTYKQIIYCDTLEVQDFTLRYKENASSENWCEIPLIQVRYVGVHSDYLNSKNY